jgi:serine/threonine-protein kinase
MRIASDSLRLDAQALALLDRLLDATAPERAAELEALGRTDPALQLRLQRLLAAAEGEGHTRGIAAPLIQAQRQLGTAPHAAGDLIAGWRLLRELGQGGMSTVWLAERAEGGLKRQAALKLPLVPHLSGMLAERFARERDVLAALDHPHIARLFDAGVAADGQPFIVLEVVQGRPIDVAAQGLSTRQKLQLFLQVLGAVEHAHRHLTVHRDLKPGNILVDEQGQVKLLDFGIAKLLAAPADAVALTLEAGTVLTPRYAAPEQVLGQAVTTATDVYAAGVVLYELLTGRLPYAEGESGVTQVMHAVVHDAPRPPGLSTDLDTVLLKALRKAPDERYASIERFAEDLRRLLADEPILARRVPWWQRTRLLLRRHRATAWAAAACVLLVVAAATAGQQARESRAQQARVDAVRGFVFSMIADAEPAQGRTEVTGRELLDAAVERARREFAADPRLQGELLGELGRVYFRLQQPDASASTLLSALDLLQPRVAADDPALNRTRAVLARSLMARDGERAQALAQQALAACTRRDAACAEARAYALYALTAIASWQGRHEIALEHARAMVRETAQAYGPSHAEMAPALEALATAARNHGALDEARKAVEQAQAMASQAQMKAANRDRLDLLQAVLEIDLGDYAAARGHVRALMQRPAAASERSTQWRMLSSAELGLGLPAQAQAAAASAAQALPPGAPTAAHWYARQAWGHAASRAAQHAQAVEALAQAREGLTAAGFAPTSASVLRVRRLWAEALLRQGQDEPAKAELQAVVAAIRAAPAAQSTEQGLALSALGCAQALTAAPEPARISLADAQARLADALPEGHPHRLRAAALAALATDPRSAEWPVRRFLKTLAADSPLAGLAGLAVRDCRALV